MTSVVKGFGAPSSNGSGNGNDGTEFMSMLSPPKEKVEGYDNTIPCSQQTIAVPSLFAEAMSVREAVYGEQGVPLEAEFDEDDARSWHWIAYASVASTSAPPKDLRVDSPKSSGDDSRRSSASATRVPVATIRLIPPPHAPNKYLDHGQADKHADASPPEGESAHPAEPYVKLGRLATLGAYRGLGLAGLLINAALDYAKQNPDTIYKPPSPTAMERAQIKDHGKEQLAWNGLVMIHAQANIKKMWEKHGFREELKNDEGRIEIAAEPHWIEEGIEHIGMWKRIEVKRGRSALHSSS
jgi:predicted GNAT family N-acyltransferase